MGDAVPTEDTASIVAEVIDSLLQHLELCLQPAVGVQPIMAAAEESAAHTAMEL